MINLSEEKSLEKNKGVTLELFLLFSEYLSCDIYHLDSFIHRQEKLYIR